MCLPRTWVRYSAPFSAIGTTRVLIVFIEVLADRMCRCAMSTFPAACTSAHSTAHSTAHHITQHTAHSTQHSTAQHQHSTSTAQSSAGGQHGTQHSTARGGPGGIGNHTVTVTAGSGPSVQIHRSETPRNRKNKAREIYMQGPPCPPACTCPHSSQHAMDSRSSPTRL